MTLNENLNTLFCGSKAESSNFRILSDAGLWKLISQALLIVVLIEQDQWWGSDCQIMEHCLLSSAIGYVKTRAFFSRLSAYASFKEVSIMRSPIPFFFWTRGKQLMAPYMDRYYYFALEWGCSLICLKQTWWAYLSDCWGFSLSGWTQRGSWTELSWLKTTA